MAGFSPSPTTNDQHDHQHPADLPRSSGNGSVTLRFPTLRGAMQDENGDGQQDHGGIEANSESRSNQKGAPTTTNYNLNAKPSPGGGDDSATTSLLSAASGDHPRPQTPKELAHDDAKVIGMCCSLLCSSTRDNMRKQGRAARLDDAGAIDEHDSRLVTSATLLLIALSVSLPVYFRFCISPCVCIAVYMRTDRSYSMAKHIKANPPSLQLRPPS